MIKKEITTKQDLFTIITILKDANIIFWLDGGWGVDILAGKQTREHRDIDIDFDAKDINKLLTILKALGYNIEVDQLPVRAELHSSTLGYIDIHPFILQEDGTASQANGEGGWYHFDADVFSTAIFEGNEIPCISIKGQKLFHTGYELRTVDIHDLEILDKI
jgi:lincosamide nucleotidyltransferase A/C/D/E